MFFSFSPSALFRWASGFWNSSPSLLSPSCVRLSVDGIQMDFAWLLSPSHCSHCWHCIYNGSYQHFPISFDDLISVIRFDPSRDHAPLSWGSLSVCVETLCFGSPLIMSDISDPIRSSYGPRLLYDDHMSFCQHFRPEIDPIESPFFPPSCTRIRLDWRDDWSSYLEDSSELLLSSLLLFFFFFFPPWYVRRQGYIRREGAHADESRTPRALDLVGAREFEVRRAWIVSK